jgi:DNA repair exonuclease SbcCD ATPase subunit
MADNAELATAVLELNKVADELKAIKKRADEYVHASKRLNGIGDALTSLCTVMDEVPGKLKEVVVQVAELAASIEISKAMIAETATTFPALVEKIATLDIVTAISEVNSTLQSLQSTLSADVIKVTETSKSLAEDYKVTQTALQNISNRFSALEQRQAGLESDIKVQINQILALQKTQGEIMEGISMNWRANETLIKELSSQVQTVAAQLQRKKGIFF